MTGRAEDRRVARTRRALREALIGLILERGWERITVQQVCDRADVGRSTFYMHFSDREDLLAGGFADLLQALRVQAKGKPGAPPGTLGLVRGMIDHVHEQQRLFRAVVGRRGGHAIQKKFREVVLELVREDLAGLAPPGPRLDAASHYLAGAFIEILTWWLEGRAPQNPDQVEAVFEGFTRPVLDAIRATPGGPADLRG